MSSAGYAAPGSLDEAVSLLAKNPDARVLAGGHGLLVEPGRSQVAKSLLVDLRNKGVTGKGAEKVLGEAGINIGGMQVARDTAGGHALVVLTVDSQIPVAVLSELSQEIGATTVRVVDLDS